VAEDMSEQYTFGDWLRRKRKSLDLTREELAEQVGCTAATIRKLEAEERRPSAQIVERLATIFHIPPSESSNFLVFARGDWQSAPAEPRESFPWYASPHQPRSNLPARISSLIGRERELSAVQEYLSDSNIRLVTLVGPLGIGKTRLSIEVARSVRRDFRDGVFFVSLAALENPSLVAPMLIQTLGIVEMKGQSPIERLTDVIGDQQMLLVLDNCEHLIEEAALVVSKLLFACSRLKILATSREALRVPGEWLYSVPTLEVPKEGASIDLQTASTFPGLLLFAERARAVQPGFVLNAENIQSVILICAQLDGLPLAIELLAARMRWMSPQAVVELWNDQFILSADGMRAVPARQKTLQNAIHWSYNLLSEEERRLFVRLSAFAGGFTLEAAETTFSQVIGDKSVSDIIVLLLNKSLLQQALDEGGNPRFTMLATIQKFALNCLHSAGQEVETRDRHLAYFLNLAEQAEKEIHGPDQVESMNRLEVEHDNFRVALDWALSSGQLESYLRLFGALSWFRRLRGFLEEMRTGFEKIRAQPNIVNYPMAYAKVLNAMGRVAWLQGDYGYAQMVLGESRDICEKLGAEGERALGEALDFLGMVAQWDEKDNQKARLFFEQGMELYRKCGDSGALAEGFLHLGLNALDRHEMTLASGLLEQSLALFKQVGDLWGIGRASTHLGDLLIHRREFEKAHSIFEQALVNDRRLQFKKGVVNDLLKLAALSRYREDYVQAMAFSQESLVVSRQYGLNRDMADALYSLALVRLLQNEYRSAIKLYGAARKMFETPDYVISSFDGAEFDRYLQMARGKLGMATFEVFVAEGRAMTKEQAVEYALE
jgi:predicted ATPase/DNA-binding XRE family transcriptional regulator